ncbi:DNA repair protein XRCC2 homolog isoform X2 [Ipomoea triloba]|uniref:DNA repair protein XRCC2 homolog isoform X2 n=1 Tax=Ipomoea triloba TaxID=35885 RepID=UPI00125E7953|nr:DNA repair protein XRCC2 homolog isoform X2 [Ipomoea triloba]
MFIDLDCRFDVLSLSASLKQRILKANGKSMQCLKEADAEYDKELFAESMRRFLYIRCYDSIQFLDTLKYWSFSLDGSCFCIYAAREQQQSFVSHRMLVRPSVKRKLIHLLQKYEGKFILEKSKIVKENW